MTNSETVLRSIASSPDANSDGNSAALSVRTCFIVIVGASVLCYGAMLGAISALAAGFGPG